MKDDETVQRLARVLRARPKERRLVCPHCKGEIELFAARYRCERCGGWFATLTELSVESTESP